MQTITPELKNLLMQLSQQLQSEKEKNPPLLEIWDAWVGQLDLPPQTKADHYAVLRRQIAKAGNPSSGDITWFTQMEVAPATYNKKLGYLKSCGDWAKSEGLLPVNPWLKVRNRKGSKEIIKPFSKDESAVIVAEFEKSYPAWAPFAKFLFLSGCRMSEAIGLLWGHVDFERGEICICESLAQRKDGNGYERVRKPTKTGSVRFLKINPELAKLLDRVKPASENPDELIFKNPAGTNHVDSNNFRDRWKKVLSAAGIPYRRPPHYPAQLREPCDRPRLSANRCGLFARTLRHKDGCKHLRSFDQQTQLAIYLLRRNLAQFACRLTEKLLQTRSEQELQPQQLPPC